MRRFHFALLMLTMTLLAAAAGPLLADQRPAGAPMTQKEFDDLVEVALDGETDVGPNPVHNPGKEGRKELRTEGAVKVFDGDDWSRMSPEERRDRILEFRRNGLNPDADLIIVIPQGDVFAVPRDKRQKLTERGVIRPWLNSDYVELPTSRISIQGKRNDRNPSQERDDSQEIE